MDLLFALGFMVKLVEELVEEDVSLACRSVANF